MSALRSATALLGMTLTFMNAWRKGKCNIGMVRHRQNLGKELRVLAEEVVQLV